MQFLFLNCTERCGGNLITRIADTHSQIRGPSPTHLFRLLLLNLEKYGSLEQDRNWRKFLLDAEGIFRAKLGEWRTQFSAEEYLKFGATRNVGWLLRAIYEKEASAHGKDRLFIKENQIHRFLPQILDCFPDARFVRLVRDPRDMALSWKKAPSMRGGVIRAADVWARDQEGIQRFVASLENARRLCTIRYEDLLCKPSEQLERLCDHLGVGYEREMIRFYGESNTRDTVPMVAEWKNLSRPLMASNYNKYRQDLSAEEIGYVESVCRIYMVSHGYSVEYGEDCDRDLLKAQIEKFEIYEKPEYLLLPLSEREARSRQSEVLKGFENR